MNMTDLHLPQHGCEHLDKAFLHFFEKFRMVYVGEVVVPKASKVLYMHPSTHGLSQLSLSQVYQALSEQLGVNDESMLLNVFVTKM